MASLTCADCGAGVGKADVICRRCGSSLLEDGSVLEAPDGQDAPPGQNPPPAGQDGARSTGTSLPPQVAGPERCPNCDADIPDPRNLVCVQCLTELKPPNSGSASAGTPGRGDSDADRYATVHERDGARLEMSFAFGTVELLVGEELRLGRDATDNRLTGLRNLNNVSRLHATVGLSPDGAWVRDENSTNGTFVNGRPVRAGTVEKLPEDAELRLASNVRARVRLRGAAHA
jgi:hypothetical protein